MWGVKTDTPPRLVYSGMGLHTATLLTSGVQPKGQRGTGHGKNMVTWSMVKTKLRIWCQTGDGTLAQYTHLGNVWEW